LGGRWRHGKARLSPGRIEFDPKRPWSRTVSIPVRSTSRRNQRQPRGEEAWAVNPRTRVVEVRTGAATLEWAVLDDQLLWALAEVRKRADEAGLATE
jgi:hypothetical protein